MTRASRIALVAAGTLLCASAATAGTYQVLVEDLIPGGMATGNPLTPPVAAVHNAAFQLFPLGSVASPGVEIVAEEGDPTTLLSELAANPNVYRATNGPGPFLTSSTFSIDGFPGERLSIVMMLAKSNDLITGVMDYVLPAPGTGSVSIMTAVYDAGTEVNSGLIADIPAYGNNGTGADEDGVIHGPVTSYTVQDDPVYGMVTWTFPPVARITITAPEATPVAPSTWGGIKGLFR
jgi:hypothetical protein